MNFQKKVNLNLLQEACDDAWEYLKSLGYSLKYTSDLDDYENLTHYIEYKLKNNE